MFIYLSIKCVSNKKTVFARTRILCCLQMPLSFVIYHYLHYKKYRIKQNNSVEKGRRHFFFLCFREMMIHQKNNILNYMLWMDGRDLSLHIINRSSITNYLSIFNNCQTYQYLLSTLFLIMLKMVENSFFISLN